MKKFVLIVLVTMAFASCTQKLECKGFDPAIDEMNWYFVPNAPQNIQATDSAGTSYTLTQTSLSQTASQTVKCGMMTKCMCPSPTYITEYTNSELDLLLYCKAQYFDISNSEVMDFRLQYALNYEGLDVHITNNNFTSSYTNTVVTALDTFSLLNTTYTDIYQVSDTSQTHAYWLKKDVGLIGFETNNTRYRLSF